MIVLSQLQKCICSSGGTTQVKCSPEKHPSEPSHKYRRKMFLVGYGITDVILFPLDHVGNPRPHGDKRCEIDSLRDVRELDSHGARKLTEQIAAGKISVTAAAECSDAFLNDGANKATTYLLSCVS